ncbi:MAG: Hsp20/alpha crystallin family protein [Chloroflexi bacterium]|nr:Hsp20/alpha crystallin family protein [Chloroflexota bacterium]
MSSPEPVENTPARDTGLNDFLAEITSAARELSSTIRGSVTKAISPGAKNYPPLDVYETADAVIIHTAPLDTAAPASVEVAMTGDTLTIKITTSPNTDIPEAAYLYRERRTGEFTRTLQIPRAVKATEAKARLKDNVLTITLPKVQDTGPNIINVQMTE